jgi:hypothetical protein
VNPKSGCGPRQHRPRGRGPGEVGVGAPGIERPEAPGRGGVVRLRAYRHHRRRDAEPHPSSVTSQGGSDIRIRASRWDVGGSGSRSYAENLPVGDRLPGALIRPDVLVLHADPRSPPTAASLRRPARRRLGSSRGDEGHRGVCRHVDRAQRDGGRRRPPGPAPPAPARVENRLLEMRNQKRPGPAPSGGCRCGPRPRPPRTARPRTLDPIAGALMCSTECTATGYR